MLKLPGKSDSTISAYSRAVCRIKDHYDCCPDRLKKEQLENYFGDLVETHSWSTVKIDRLICATKKMRYRVFLLATYSMGLRLTEALSLEVGDIDSERKMIHIRRGKGHKDRMVPLPDRTLQALRILWSKHRHPTFLFPNAKGSMQTIQKATTHMNIGGTQNAMNVVVRDCNIKKSLYPFASPCLRNSSP